MICWHHESSAAVLAELNTHPSSGLTTEEAELRRARYGPNELLTSPGRGLLLRFLDQLRDPMILVLLAAAVLSVLAGGGEEWVDAVIILVIIVVNAVLSIVQEEQAEKALDALGKLSAPRASVLRDGHTVRLDASLLVPGDVIFLAAGDRVPADARLLDCAALQADESTLTGESLPVSKAADLLLAEETQAADRRNMVLSSTVITAGRGSAVVTATGMDTEVGHIAGLLLHEKTVDTPLQRKMAEISRGLSLLCVAVCALVFGAGMAWGRGILEMFLTAVSLAVAAIPEGLPAIVTIVLALGVQRMAAQGAIVKKLPAVETLGCAGVICSDKTGTLTQNRMTVTECVVPPGASRPLALTIGALCTSAVLAPDRIHADGDPTETALVEAAAREGLFQPDLALELPRTAEFPFDSARKRMSTLHALPAHRARLLVKGAPDVLLPRCTFLPGGIPLTDARRREFAQRAEEMAARALRVLAVAYRDLPSPPARPSAEDLEQQLTFAGFFGMMDPPRKEVSAAVSLCRQAGIRPVMITGDHKLTAVAIAKELGIFRPGDLAVTGPELDFMPQSLLEDEISRFSVFARVTPEHKMRIVRAWQKKGAVVAMTGDGVNDAPALKVADIGCAMGKSGTDVAKSAADMILTDDNFSTITAAVRQGRGVYANIKKSIHYLLSCNIGEIVTILCATLLGFSHMPLLPVQLLWLNLVTDSLPALALGVEPVEPDVMHHPPRPAQEKLFAGAFALRLVWQGLLVGLVTLAAFLLGGGVLCARFQPAEGLSSTMAFATLTICQLFHAFDVRSETRSIVRIGILSNPAMNRAFAAGLLLQGAVLSFPPLQRIFSVVPMLPHQWMAVFALSLAPTLVCEIVKALSSLRKK